MALAGGRMAFVLQKMRTASDRMKEAGRLRVSACRAARSRSVPVQRRALAAERRYASQVDRWYARFNAAKSEYKALKDNEGVVNGT